MMAEELETSDATRCRRCGSTERGPYGNRVEKEIDCLDPAGNPCTHVIWQSVQCAACGQRRIDRSCENRPAAVVPGKTPTETKPELTGGSDDNLAAAELLRTMSWTAGTCVSADVERTRKLPRRQSRVQYL